jgi:hypothetical protein
MTSQLLGHFSWCYWNKDSVATRSFLVMVLKLLFCSHYIIFLQRLCEGRSNNYHVVFLWWLRDDNVEATKSFSWNGSKKMISRPPNHFFERVVGLTISYLLDCFFMTIVRKWFMVAKSISHDGFEMMIWQPLGCVFWKVVRLTI